MKAVPEEEKRAAIYGVHVTHADKDVPPNIKLSENVVKLYEIVYTLTSRTNNYQKARRILARILGGHKKSLPVSSEAFKRALSDEPTVDRLKRAEDLTMLVAAWEVTPYISKLTTLGPVYQQGVWCCKGRLARGLENLMGKKKLPIIAKNSRLAELLMLDAHKKNHEGVAGTLAASRAQAWILKGRYLARRVVQGCLYCRIKKHKLQAQQMGALPEERLNFGSKPFHAICLGLLGPILVKSMVKKRDTMKVWQEWGAQSSLI